MTDLQIICQILAIKRKKMGLSRKEVSNRLNISEKTIYNIENGNDFKVSSLMAYSELLYCQVVIQNTVPC